MDLRPGGCCYPCRRNPVVDDAVIVANDRGRCRRGVIEMGCLLVGQGMTIQVRVAEVADIDEGKGVDAQAEPEGGADVPAVVGESEA